MRHTQPPPTAPLTPVYPAPVSSVPLPRPCCSFCRASASSATLTRATSSTVQCRSHTLFCFFSSSFGLAVHSLRHHPWRYCSGSRGAMPPHCGASLKTRPLRFGASVGARPFRNMIISKLLCPSQSLTIPRTPCGAEPLQTLELPTSCRKSTGRRVT